MWDLDQDNYDIRQDEHVGLDDNNDDEFQIRNGFHRLMSTQSGRLVVCRCGARLILPEIGFCFECPDCGRVHYVNEG